jgi:hypothetical protein
MAAHLDYRLDAHGLGTATLARTLALPEGNPRSIVLARRWAAELKSGSAIVQHALTHFRNEAFYYTLNPPLLGEHSVDDFSSSVDAGFANTMPAPSWF